VVKLSNVKKSVLDKTEDTKVTIKKSVKYEARALGLNFSKVLENELERIIKQIKER